MDQKKQENLESLLVNRFTPNNTKPNFFAGRRAALNDYFLLLQDFLRDTALGICPRHIHILKGNYGIGKTTFLLRLKKQIQEECQQFITVYLSLNECGDNISLYYRMFFQDLETAIHSSPTHRELLLSFLRKKNWQHLALKISPTLLDVAYKLMNVDGKLQSSHILFEILKESYHTAESFKEVIQLCNWIFQEIGLYILLVVDDLEYLHIYPEFLEFFLAQFQEYEKYRSRFFVIFGVETNYFSSILDAIPQYNKSPLSAILAPSNTIALKDEKKIAYTLEILLHCFVGYERLAFLQISHDTIATQALQYLTKTCSECGFVVQNLNFSEPNILAACQQWCQELVQQLGQLKWRNDAKLSSSVIENCKTLAKELCRDLNFSEMGKIFIQLFSTLDTQLPGKLLLVLPNFERLITAIFSPCWEKNKIGEQLFMRNNAITPSLAFLNFIHSLEQWVQKFQKIAFLPILHLPESEFPLDTKSKIAITIKEYPAYELLPLSKLDAFQLLQEISARSGLTFAPDILDDVYQRLGGIPLFLHSFGSYLIENIPSLLTESERLELQQNLLHKIEPGIPFSPRLYASADGRFRLLIEADLYQQIRVYSPDDLYTKLFCKIQEYIPQIMLEILCSCPAHLTNSQIMTELQKRGINITQEVLIKYLQQLQQNFWITCQEDRIEISYPFFRQFLNKTQQTNDNLEYHQEENTSSHRIQTKSHISAHKPNRAFSTKRLMLPKLELGSNMAIPITSLGQRSDNTSDSSRQNLPPPYLTEPINPLGVGVNPATNYLPSSPIPNLRNAIPQTPPFPAPKGTISTNHFRPSNNRASSASDVTVNMPLDNMPPPSDMKANIPPNAETPNIANAMAFANAVQMASVMSANTYPTPNSSIQHPSSALPPPISPNSVGITSNYIANADIAPPKLHKIATMPPMANPQKNSPTHIPSLTRTPGSNPAAPNIPNPAAPNIPNLTAPNIPNLTAPNIPNLTAPNIPTSLAQFANMSLNKLEGPVSSLPSAMIAAAIAANSANNQNSPQQAVDDKIPSTAKTQLTLEDPRLILEREIANLRENRWPGTKTLEHLSVHITLKETHSHFKISTEFIYTLAGFLNRHLRLGLEVPRIFSIIKNFLIMSSQNHSFPNLLLALQQTLGNQEGLPSCKEEPSCLVKLYSMLYRLTHEESDLTKVIQQGLACFSQLPLSPDLATWIQNLIVEVEAVSKDSEAGRGKKIVLLWLSKLLQLHIRPVESVSPWLLREFSPSIIPKSLYSHMLTYFDQLLKNPFVPNIFLQIIPTYGFLAVENPQFCQLIQNWCLDSRSEIQQIGLETWMVALPYFQEDVKDQRLQFLEEKIAQYGIPEVRRYLIEKLGNCYVMYADSFASFYYGLLKTEENRQVQLQIYQILATLKPFCNIEFQEEIGGCLAQYFLNKILGQHIPNIQKYLTQLNCVLDQTAREELIKNLLTILDTQNMQTLTHVAQSLAHLYFYLSHEQQKIYQNKISSWLTQTGILYKVALEHLDILFPQGISQLEQATDWISPELFRNNSLLAIAWFKRCSLSIREHILKQWIEVLQYAWLMDSPESLEQTASRFLPSLVEIAGCGNEEIVLSIEQFISEIIIHREWALLHSIKSLRTLIPYLNESSQKNLRQLAWQAISDNTNITPEVWRILLPICQDCPDTNSIQQWRKLRMMMNQHPQFLLEESLFYFARFKQQWPEKFAKDLYQDAYYYLQIPEYAMAAAAFLSRATQDIIHDMIDLVYRWQFYGTTCYLAFALYEVFPAYLAKVPELATNYQKICRSEPWIVALQVVNFHRLAGNDQRVQELLDWIIQSDQKCIQKQGLEIYYSWQLRKGNAIKAQQTLSRLYNIFLPELGDATKSSITT